MMTRVSLSVTQMASLVLAICFSAPGFAQQGGNNQQMMDLVLQVQALQEEVRQLRGQLEEQAYELENLKSRQRDQYLDLDSRLSQQRAAPGGAGAATPPAGNALPVVPAAQAGGDAGAVADNAPPAPREDVPEVRAPMETPSTTTAIADPATESRGVQASPEEEQAAYDRAFQALKELRYADAAEGFRDFLAQYPDSPLAGNAQYWLGESYYVTRNYEIAVGAFQGLLDKYPDSGKAGDALLKLGFTHYELKQWDRARAALEQVQQRYPDTTLARLAESRLRSMRLEGHI